LALCDRTAPLGAPDDPLVKKTTCASVSMTSAAGSSRSDELVDLVDADSALIGERRGRGRMRSIDQDERRIAPTDRAGHLFGTPDAVEGHEDGTELCEGGEDRDGVQSRGGPRRDAVARPDTDIGEDACGAIAEVVHLREGQPPVAERGRGPLRHGTCRVPEDVPDHEGVGHCAHLLRSPPEPP